MSSKSSYRDMHMVVWEHIGRPPKSVRTNLVMLKPRSHGALGET